MRRPAAVSDRRRERASLSLVVRRTRSFSSRERAARLTGTFSIRVRLTSSSCVRSPSSPSTAMSRHSCVLRPYCSAYTRAIRWLTTFAATESRYGRNSSRVRLEGRFRLIVPSYRGRPTGTTRERSPGRIGLASRARCPSHGGRVWALGPGEGFPGRPVGVPLFRGPTRRGEDVSTLGGMTDLLQLFAVSAVGLGISQTIPRERLFAP